MMIVNSRDFAINQEKYFDMAKNEDVCIKRGMGMFHLIYQPVERYPEQVILKPDDNLQNAITADELLERVHEDIRNKFAMRI